MGHTLSFAVGGKRRFEYRIALQGLIGTFLVWGVLIAIALIHDGTRWPRSSPAIPKDIVPGFPGRRAMSSFEAWENMILLWCIVEFLLLKSWAMIRRQQWDRRNPDWLTIGLVLPNLAFALIYAYAMGASLFGWETTANVFRFVLRYPLIAVLVLGAAQLCLVPDQPPPPEPEPPWDRKSNRRVGPAERRVST